MSRIIFSEQALEEYTELSQDKKKHGRIITILKDIIRNGYDGIGKPEPLKGNFSGFWSRRIDDVNRIVYKVSDDGIEIIQCKGHYDDK